MSAEKKLRAVVERGPGWQRAFTKDARRVLSGAVAGATSGRCVMPNERTKHERGRGVCPLEEGRFGAMRGSAG